MGKTMATHQDTHPFRLLELADNGTFPNSPYPVIHYPDVLTLPRLFRGQAIKRLFARRKWGNAWDAGVYTFHHYHSICHEVLGFYEGSTELQLGGDPGSRIWVKKGDVLIIPAGVAHRNLGGESDVRCIGAYAGGRNFDILRGQPAERPAADERIAAVPLPQQDPVYGPSKGLPLLWAPGLGSRTSR